MTDTTNSVTDALQLVEWPIMPPRKGQSPVLFDDGYDEGWAKCLEACKAALAATKQENNMTIFALEQCVENGVDLNISDAESALAELNTLRAQLAEAQRELIAKESERAGLELERNNAQRQHTMQCAINKADSQRILELTAQLAEAQRDSERLDWLDKYCTGASDSERYLPRKVYWSGGTSRDVRVAIDAAKGESNGTR